MIMNDLQSIVVCGLAHRRTHRQRASQDLENAVVGSVGSVGGERSFWLLLKTAELLS